MTAEQIKPADCTSVDNKISETGQFTTYKYELIAPRTLIRSEEVVNIGAIPSGSIVAQTLYSVISPGTEIAAWTGKPPLRPSKVYPRVLGYCNVARVIAIGSGVSRITVGSIVLTHQCHRSGFCCDSKEVLLVIDATNGRESQRELAASYLYHISYTALMNGGFRPGYEVAIIGFGALGFAAAGLVSAYGGRPLIFSGRTIDECSRRSIPYAQFFSKKGMDCKDSLSDMGGVDIVINSSDSWDDYALGLNLVRRGGTVALVGFPGRGIPPPEFNPLDSRHMYDKAISILQVAHVVDLDVPAIDVRFTLKRNLRHIFSLLKDKRIDPSPLINAQFSSNDLAAALNFLEKRPVESKAAILEWAC